MAFRGSFVTAQPIRKLCVSRIEHELLTARPAFSKLRGLPWGSLSFGFVREAASPAGGTDGIVAAEEDIACICPVKFPPPWELGGELHVVEWRELLDAAL